MEHCRLGKITHHTSHVSVGEGIAQAAFFFSPLDLHVMPPLLCLTHTAFRYERVMLTWKTAARGMFLLMP